jgi:hypothetical protein
MSAAPETDNVHEMTKDQLMDIILEQKLPIEPESYSDILQLRKDVADAIADIEAFVKNKAERERIAREAAELEALNPDIADDSVNEEYEQPTEPVTEPPVADNNPLKGLE